MKKTKKMLAAILLMAACGTAAHAAYTVVPATAAPAAYDVVPASVTFVAADSVNGNGFTCTGREMLIVYNSDVTAHTITVTSVADSSGRLGDSTKNVNAGAYYVFQMFPPAGWRQSDGTVRFTASDPTMKVAVIRFP